jgi:polysaccharide export outer membrane protein
MKKLLFIVSFMISSITFAVDNVIDKGDILRVSVYGNPDLTTETKVSEEGVVSFPLIGGVRVAGLSVMDTEQKISQRLVGDGFLKHAQVNIIVIQSTGQQVSVLGQVAKPGKYSIESGAKNLFDFVAISGGVSASGSDVITVIRMSEKPPQRVTVNVKELFLHLGADQINNANLEMHSGDIIYVPEAPVFYVYGEANRPGVYRFKQGMTVAQAISTAGGVSGRGTDSGLVVKRRDKKGDIAEHEVTLSTAISANDVIVIEESLF